MHFCLITDFTDVLNTKNTKHLEVESTFYKSNFSMFVNMENPSESQVSGQGRDRRADAAAHTFTVINVP